MKRNKAIDLIEAEMRLFIATYKAASDVAKPIMLRVFSETLLDRLEKLGMKPPVELVDDGWGNLAEKHAWSEE